MAGRLITPFSNAISANSPHIVDARNDDGVTYAMTDIMKATEVIERELFYMREDANRQQKNQTNPDATKNDHRAVMELLFTCGRGVREQSYGVYHWFSESTSIQTAIMDFKAGIAALQNNAFASRFFMAPEQQARIETIYRVARENAIAHGLDPDKKPTLQQRFQEYFWPELPPSGTFSPASR